jgi:prepilin-type N-terminal cleavage/methylation domain-containing protein
MNTSRQRGFTLWELLIALLVAGILLGIGVPNVMEFQRSGLMTAAANDLVTSVLVARTEAVKRQAPVTWCLSNNWTAATPTCAQGLVANSRTLGYVVFVDENNNFDATGARILTDLTDGNAVIDGGEFILSRVPAPGGRIDVSATCGYATFTPTGALRQVGAFCIPAAPALANPRVIFFCDDRGRRVTSGNVSSARAVRIDVVGRANVFQEITDITNRFAAVSGAPVNAVCPP